MRVAILAIMITTHVVGCATAGAPPVYVGDTPSNRIYWDHYQGDGYRIKVARDVGQMGSLCMTQIFINGSLAAEVGQGEAVVFKVPTGTHQLKITPALKSSICQKIYSSPEFHIEQAVSGNAGEVKDFRYGFSRSGNPFLAIPKM